MDSSTEKRLLNSLADCSRVSDAFHSSQPSTCLVEMTIHKHNQTHTNTNSPKLCQHFTGRSAGMTSLQKVPRVKSNKIRIKNWIVHSPSRRDYSRADLPKTFSRWKTLTASYRITFAGSESAPKMGQGVSLEPSLHLATRTCCRMSHSKPEQHVVFGCLWCVWFWELGGLQKQGCKWMQHVGELTHLVT